MDPFCVFRVRDGANTNSGIGSLGQTEILWSFHKFWNCCFGSSKDSVAIPKILKLVIWVKQRFCGDSRNSGIVVLDQAEILWPFQKIWKRCYGSKRDSDDISENNMESEFWVNTKAQKCFGQPESLCLFQKFWNFCFG